MKACTLNGSLKKRKIVFGNVSAGRQGSTNITETETKVGMQVLKAVSSQSSKQVWFWKHRALGRLPHRYLIHVALRTMLPLGPVNIISCYLLTVSDSRSRISFRHWRWTNGEQLSCVYCRHTILFRFGRLFSFSPTVMCYAVHGTYRDSSESS